MENKWIVYLFHYAFYDNRLTAITPTDDKVKILLSHSFLPFF
jgi:hypothetical protein